MTTATVFLLVAIIRMSIPKAYFNVEHYARNRTYKNEWLAIMDGLVASKNIEQVEFSYYIASSGSVYSPTEPVTVEDVRNIVEIICTAVDNGE